MSIYILKNQDSTITLISGIENTDEYTAGLEAAGSTYKVYQTVEEIPGIGETPPIPSNHMYFDSDNHLRIDWDRNKTLMTPGDIKTALIEDLEDAVTTALSAEPLDTTALIILNCKRWDLSKAGNLKLYQAAKQAIIDRNLQAEKAVVLQLLDAKIAELSSQA